MSLLQFAAREHCDLLICTGGGGSHYFAITDFDEDDCFRVFQRALSQIGIAQKMAGKSLYTMHVECVKGEHVMAQANWHMLVGPLKEANQALM